MENLYKHFIPSLIFVICASSCSNLEDNIIESEYNNIRDAYSNLNSVDNFYKNGTYWQEAEYLTDHPEKATVILYQIRINNSTSELELYKDQSLLGNISCDGISKVYFKSLEQNEKQLLYNFSEIEMTSDGVYLKTYKAEPYFMKFKDFTLPHEYIKGTCFESLWKYDKFEAITISNIGSTSGILTPIVGVAPKKYVRELLRFSCYLPTFIHGNETNISDSSSGDYGYYSNTTSPVIDYLPSDFWQIPERVKEPVYQ